MSLGQVAKSRGSRSTRGSVNHGIPIRKNTMSTYVQMDLSPGMPGGIGVVPIQDVAARVVGYCTHPRSGWHTYDMPGLEARRGGHFKEIAPWSLLWATALSGRLSASDVARFTHEFRSKLLQRLTALSAKDLAEMDDDEVKALALLCRSGFSGLWAPKVTKMLALYRPDAVPVLDGHVAMAMGFKRDGFRAGKEPRWDRIERTLLTLRSILRQQHGELTHVRDQVAHEVSDIGTVTDLRLLDIIIWTSQDDRIARAGSPTDFWLNRQPRDYQPGRFDPLPLQ
ncbi:DUF6308 family protein [Arthrobacter sp. Soil762]|uniref:DUF6308 family protein n=1 Tax=Arthrobacter sp. Soil762 TaxID=1736401 RepID=UPI000ADFC887